MAVLFISHSSKDDVAVNVLEAWLRAHGFSDIFIDHHSIAGGDAWGEALQSAAGTCRVVVCVITENWLVSHECFGEFQASKYMGKRIIPLFMLAKEASRSEEAEKRLAKVRAHCQGLDLVACLQLDGGLDLDVDESVANRLTAGLREAGAASNVGLDPESFAIDRMQRPIPFPGLLSFGDDDADAALFYGRSREIAEALEELRQMRARSDRKAMVILGASGAGKSSLLKAGIIPRLRREKPGWLPLRAFRPGSDPLLNFAEALARTHADFGKIQAPGIIRDRLFGAWSNAGRASGGLTAAGRMALEAALEGEGLRLRAVAGLGGASILISVDQAEEMARSESESVEALVDYVRAALAMAANGWQLALTVRTDSFSELQNHRRFQNLETRVYDLRALPVIHFVSVVVTPAERYGVKIDNVLVDTLIEDAPMADALPLLAFTLQRLWRQYAASGNITKNDYDKLGGLRGLIEDAAERALRGLATEHEAPLPSTPATNRLVSLCSATFVPALVQISNQGEAIGHVAAWKSFDEEQQNLLAQFVGWRLLVRKGEDDGGTVEVAHEALFREWTRLKRWLEPERARLEMLRSLEIDASTWDRNGRNSIFLNHRGRRLAEAKALAENQRYRDRLGKKELDYLASCRDFERSAQRRSRRIYATVAVLTFGVVAGLVGWLNETTLRDAIYWITVARPYMLAQFWPHVLSLEAERALKPGQRYRECAKDCPWLVVVPAGKFIMGAPEAEAAASEGDMRERPLREVSIAKIAVSEYEVTFDDWDACAAHGDCNPHVSDSNWGRGRRPVINVTWYDAGRYAAWLSRMTGKEYRLLSEAEYEYAARAGSQTIFPWGDDIGTGHANCHHGCGAQRDATQTAPVGSFAPNQFDLYDMVGNVWEWVEDCAHKDYTGAPTDGSAWISNGDCDKRVARGGSWFGNAQFVRSAMRNSFGIFEKYGLLGFRVGHALPN